MIISLAERQKFSIMRKLGRNARLRGAFTVTSRSNAERSPLRSSEAFPKSGEIMSGYTMVGLIGFITCIAVAFLLGAQLF